MNLLIKRNYKNFPHITDALMIQYKCGQQKKFEWKESKIYDGIVSIENH